MKKFSLGILVLAFMSSSLYGYSIYNGGKYFDGVCNNGESFAGTDLGDSYSVTGPSGFKVSSSRSEAIRKACGGIKYTFYGFPSSRL